MPNLPAFPLRPELQERLDLSGQEFLARFLSLGSKRNPSNLVVLSELAQVLTLLGRYQEGLEVDLKLAALSPQDELVHYNLACSYSLLSRHSEALDALERSIDLGYNDLAHLLQDEDLMALDSEPRFHELTKRLGG